jgi:hypothetical protein
MYAHATSKSAYACDTDLLIREVLAAREELFKRTARRPCRVLLHPLDCEFLITTPIGRYGPVVGIDADGRRWFFEMAMFTDLATTPGMARVEISDGCLSYWRSCEHRTQPGVDIDGLARRVGEAIAERQVDAYPWQRADVPPAESRSTAAAPEPVAKRTRRPSKQELERRAAAAERKAREAAAKAERARQALEGGS